MSQGGWKRHLLRSGVPLEYEVAQILARRDMSISADLSFMRRDGIVAKESSVDIEAQWYDNDDPNLSLHLLIECKYRTRNKTILFLLDPNDLYPPATLGGTVQSFDFAVPYTLPLNAFKVIDRSLEYVYKGVEVSDDGAFEEQIWHGIQQLRYGVPVNLRRSLEFTLHNHLDSSYSLFFSNILVTNAPIRILQEGCTLADIEAADSLEIISSERECVILYSDYGPDYEDHFRSIFQGASDDSGHAAKARREALTGLGKQMNILNDPVRLFADLENAERYPTRRVSTQFFVVTLVGLDKLLGRIQDSCRTAFDSRSVARQSE